MQMWSLEVSHSLDFDFPPYTLPMPFLNVMTWVLFCDVPLFFFFFFCFSQTRRLLVPDGGLAPFTLNPSQSAMSNITAGLPAQVTSHHFQRQKKDILCFIWVNKQLKWFCMRRLRLMCESPGCCQDPLRTRCTCLWTEAARPWRTSSSLYWSWSLTPVWFSLSYSHVSSVDVFYGRQHKTHAGKSLPDK